MRLGLLARAFAAMTSGLVLASCGSSTSYGGGGGCTPTATQVCMVNLSFNQMSLTVPVGSTVTWNNGSTTTHSVTSATGSTDVFGQDVAVGATFQHTFTTKGTYPYYCRFHGANGTPPTGMSGSITVN